MNGLIDASIPTHKAIKPFVHPLRGQSIALPGSKSLSNRALILAALSDGPVALVGLNSGEDVQIMIANLRALGFSIEIDSSQTKAIVRGLSGRIPNAHATLHVGNAGTVARFLPALCALHPKGIYRFEGSGAMQERPMEPLLAVLENQGCQVIYHQKTGHYPFTLQTKALSGGPIIIEGSSSSQFGSALMMVAPFAKQAVFLKPTGRNVSEPFIEMTAKIMADFGITPERTAIGWTIPERKTYHALSYCIEADWTQASYFAALALVLGGSLFLENLRADSYQGDRAFIAILELFGLQSEYVAKGLHLKSNLVFQKDTQKLDFSAISDTFLTLAAIAPLLGGSIEISGIAHTSRQESNRPLAMSHALKQLGQTVSLTDDCALHITPRTLRSGRIQTHSDHRIAMSFAILGSANPFKNGKSWLVLDNAPCVSKTFPDFFHQLEGLHNP